MDTNKVTRVEVINHVAIAAQPTGRVFVFGPYNGVKVDIQFQDQGRTLKVFISDRDAKK